MYIKTIEIVNDTGLHARPASEFVSMAAKYASRITIRKLPAGVPVNAKSIVMILTMGLNQGSQAELQADGPDEREAVDSLAALAAAGFGEL